jgi:transposase
MAKRYRPVDRDQPYLFPPSMRDWLPEDHPVWLVITAVEDHMDTSAFHAGRKTGGAGTAGYDPDMLVTLLVWAYAHQVTSSRDIERLCLTDVAFRVICGGNTPRHVTVAEFRKAFPGAIGEFFAEVLALCARLGMGKLGVVALDGMKIAANASKSANRTEQTLAKMAAETVARHGETDAAEDDLFGEGHRGDEVPPDAWSPRRRGQRIAAALASVRAGREAAEQAEAARAQAFRERREAGQRTGPAPLASAVELAAENLERARAAQQARIEDWHARNQASLAATGRPLRGGRPVPADDHTRVRQAAAKLERATERAAAAAARAAQKEKNRKGPGPVRNITDPDSRLMPVRGGGFVQGYNTQNVTSGDGLIMATELTGDTTDMAWFKPMMDAAEDAAGLIAAHRAAAGHPGDSPDGASPDQGSQDAGPGYRPPPPDGQDTAQIAWLIKLFLSDAGYCSADNINAPGPPRLIATGKLRDLEKAARGSDDAVPWASQALAAMAALLQTKDGITAYRQRGHIAETPHGNIKHNMGFRQLTVRGKPKAAAEWTFAAAVHNLFKAITSGHLTAQALARLDSRAAYPPAAPA